ncbi:hypothetical protein MML48_4g00013666 [Holotrichia oblita]|uniref:Uncharacterized protein n=1 Tax=Holotrichia oblita TaxID=644536 RepID=A0ACB9T9Z1_HOLOL|nr:hypothetical protein MML48_4g00013666 [Holotrichia oblita]
MNVTVKTYNEDIEICVYSFIECCSQNDNNATQFITNKYIIFHKLLTETKRHLREKELSRASIRIEDIRPYPKASERKQKSRQRIKSRILTDSPKKTEICIEQLRNAITKEVPRHTNNSSDSETDISLTSSSDSDEIDLDISSSDGERPNVKSLLDSDILQESQFVLVKFIQKRTNVFYTAKIIKLLERFPERRQPEHRIFKRLMSSLEEYGSFERHRSRKYNKVFRDETEITVLAKVEAEPSVSSRPIENELGVPRKTALNILRKNRYHPYKIRVLHDLLPGMFHNSILSIKNGKEV